MSVLLPTNGALSNSAGLRSAAALLRPVRVLHLISGDGRDPGLATLLNATERQTCESLVATLSAANEWHAQLQAQGHKVTALDCLSRHRYPLASWQLRRILLQERIDVIHAHGHDAAPLALAVAMQLDRRVIVTPLPGDQAGRRQARLTDWIHQRADHFIVSSQQERDRLMTLARISAARISVLPWVQSPSRFNTLLSAEVARLRTEFGAAARPLLVCATRLSSGGGHRYLLEAFARLTRAGLTCAGLNASLVLVGDGPLQSSLAWQAAEAGLTDRVQFTGWRADALALLAAADVVVHPAVHENWPTTVCEALLLGRPLVTTDGNGIRELVGNNERGLIVPPADVEALWAALAWTITGLAEAEAKAEQGRRELRDYLDAGRVAREHVECYRRVAAVQSSHEPALRAAG